jgi:hypothetical protein
MPDGNARVVAGDRFVADALVGLALILGRKQSFDSRWDRRTLDACSTVEVDG